MRAITKCDDYPNLIPAKKLLSELQLGNHFLSSHAILTFDQYDPKTIENLHGQRARLVICFLSPRSNAWT